MLMESGVMETVGIAGLGKLWSHVAAILWKVFRNQSPQLNLTYPNPKYTNTQCH